MSKKNVYPLNGKVILITGAAGGIGAATARALYARGASLVLTDVHSAMVDELAAEFDRDRVLPLALDVTDSNASRAVVDRAVARFGQLDVVFANAGIAWRGAPATLLTCDEEEFERIVDVDLLGVWRTVRAALPEIIRARGQVLVTASIYSFLNGMANAPYAVSKAAVESLARALAAELGGTGATAGVVYPGWTATDIARIAFGGHDLATKLNEKALPGFLRRPITAAQVADAIVTGLQRRAPRIIAPRRWVPLFLLRGIVNPLSDRYLSRHAGLQQLLGELESRARVADKGDAGSQ